MVSWLAHRYANGVKTRLSTLGTGDVPRKTVGPVSDKIWGTQKNDWRDWNRHYQCISGIRLGVTVKIEDSRYAIWLPCPQAVWGAICRGFIPKLLSYLGV